MPMPTPMTASAAPISRYANPSTKPGSHNIADDGTDDHAADQRKQLDPSRLRIVTQDDLDVRRKDEHHAEEAEAGDDKGHRRPGEATVTEVLEVDEGRRMAKVPDNEHGQD